MRLLNKLFPKNPNHDEFAALVSKQFAGAGVHVRDYDQEQFRLTLPDDGFVFLHNCYANYCSSTKSNRNAILEQFVSGLANQQSIPAYFKLARPNLIPIVRSAAYHSLAQLQARTTGGKYPTYQNASKSVAGHLIISLAFDTKHSMQLINKSSFDAWGITFPEALKTAEENLRDRTDPTKFVEPFPGVFVGQWEDSYEASRILLMDLVYRLLLHGEPVAFLPSRNLFLLTGSKNSAGLKWMLEYGKQRHFEAYPLSPSLYLLSGSNWISFVPEEEELRSLLKSIERSRHSLDYAQQKQYLETIHEKDGIDIFVASFTIYEVDETKRQFSVCVWSKDVDSLLPVTDQIVLLVNAQTKDLVKTSWTTAKSIVGHHMEERTDIIPHRYRVRTFPCPAEIELLRAHLD